MNCEEELEFQWSFLAHNEIVLNVSNNGVLATFSAMWVSTKPILQLQSKENYGMVTLHAG